jgi:hypothetical protein
MEVVLGTDHCDLMKLVTLARMTRIQRGTAGNKRAAGLSAGSQNNAVRVLLCLRELDNNNKKAIVCDSFGALTFSTAFVPQVSAPFLCFGHCLPIRLNSSSLTLFFEIAYYEKAFVACPASPPAPGSTTDGFRFRYLA